MAAAKSTMPDRVAAPGIGILVGLTRAKGEKPGPGGPPPMAEGAEPPRAGMGVNPDFEEAIIQVFPELEGDTRRLEALQRAIEVVIRG